MGITDRGGTLERGRDPSSGPERAAALLATGALQTAIFNSANFSSIATDAAGVIQIFNVGAERMLGYRASDVVNKMTPAGLSDAEELVARAAALSLELAQSIVPGFEALVFKAAHGMEDFYELTYIRKDGSRFPAAVSVTALRDAHDVIIGYLLISTDNTARKQLESERATHEDWLRTHEADEHRFRLAEIVDSSDDGIISKALDGTITTWNRGAQRIFGWSADEMVGDNVLRLMVAGHEREEPEILQKLARGERVPPFDTVRLRKDGSEVHVCVTISPLRDSVGNLVGASKIVQDITERRRAVQELARAKESAEAASRELETFSYAVAHDLRAPLRGMNGFAQVLLEKRSSLLDATAKDWLNEIVANAQKMGSLIDALLSLSRLTRGERRYEPVDLSAMARACLARLSLGEPGRVVEQVIQDDLVTELDPVLALALVENLMSNAWKFTSKVPHARIELGQTRTQDVDAFFVRDNGAGFDMAFAAKLFGHFQRLHTVAEFPGIGIGLATVQRIVHRHGGRVWAEGVVNGGATFYFTFPPREIPPREIGASS